MSPRLPILRPFAALAVTAALAACAATPAPPSAPPPLWGSEWQLQSIGEQAVLPQPVATLAFAPAAQLAGHGACNRFFGPVTIEHDRLRVGPLASTRMACMGAAGEQEARYLGALQQARRYEVQGDTLLIHTQGMDRPLRFVRTAPRP